MNNLIQEKIAGLPSFSGIYLMRDESGEIIYVGKAKNLKNRVSQYFQKTNKPEKVKAMVEKIRDFDYFITPSEIDALALENNLIKKHQPFYNILLKDDKTFPYIKVNLNEDFPKFEVVRRIKKDKAKYFGPFISGISVSEIVKIINFAFPLRTCNLKISENSSKKNIRECLNFHIGLCSAPCTKKVSKEKYRQIVVKAIDFLNGDDSEVAKAINLNMENFAKQENFEMAIKCRDRLKMLKRLKEQTITNLNKTKDLDVIAHFSNGINSVVCVMVIRGGKVLGVDNFNLFDASLSEKERISSFILQYYSQNIIIPKVVLVQTEIENKNVLEQYFENKTEFVCPQKGVNFKLVEMATKNAEQHLKKSIDKETIKNNETIVAMKNLQKELGLKNLPKRIECYDISNIQGTDKVASMVVFENGQKANKEYRKFKIKTVEGIDDFASLQETLERRLERLKKNDKSFSKKPDLILIDGGKGQLSSCVTILKNSGVDGIEIISLAKKFEEVFVPENTVPIYLKRASVELRLLQNLRDEAHRFAITFHRNLRGKRQTASELDSIKGLGQVGKKELLKHFKTLSKIKEASLIEIESVQKINKQTAKNVYEKFKKEQE